MIVRVDKVVRKAADAQFLPDVQPPLLLLRDLLLEAGSVPNQIPDALVARVELFRFRLADEGGQNAVDQFRKALGLTALQRHGNLVRIRHRTDLQRALQAFRGMLHGLFRCQKEGVVLSRLAQRLDQNVVPVDRLGVLLHVLPVLLIGLQFVLHRILQIRQKAGRNVNHRRNAVLRLPFHPRDRRSRQHHENRDHEGDHPVPVETPEDVDAASSRSRYHDRRTALADRRGSTRGRRDGGNHRDLILQRWLRGAAHFTKEPRMANDVTGPTFCSR